MSSINLSIPMAETTKLEESRRHPSIDLAATAYQNTYKKKGEFSEQTIPSPVLVTNTPSISSPRGHIDAQTYVDAQSNGLANRSIRYLEESQKNSRICNRMYKRVGDFPIVHLDKSKKILNPRKSFVHQPKIARIGQPDPSTYRTSIRSEILRNGTLLPQMTVHHHEDVDNEFGLDPLDALKEISRKRIHCEDNSNNQKQIEAVTKDSTDSIPSSVSSNNSKRQRVTTSPNLLITNESNNKRHCSTKNNDIISSLSSSSHLLPSLKRLPTSPPSNSISSPQTKRIQRDASIESSNIDLTIESTSKITDVVATNIETSVPVKPAQPKLSLFNKTYQPYVPSATVDENDSDDECKVKIAFVKPKQTTEISKEVISNFLKLKPVEKTKLSLMLSCLSGELDDSDTVDSKTQPKESSVSATTNISIPSSAEEKEKMTTCAPNPIEHKIDVGANSTQMPVPPITTTLASQVDSSSILSSSVFIKPTTTPTTSSDVSVTKTITVAATTSSVTTSKTTDVDQRKGGFSFPITPTTTPTVKPNPEPIPRESIPSSTSNLTTIGFQTSNQNTTPTMKPSSVVAPIIDPTKTFSFGTNNENTTPSMKSSSTVAPIVGPTKTFSFGSANESKIVPAFGSTTANMFGTPSLSTTSTTTATPTEQAKTTALVDVSKPNSFPVFGQSPAMTTVKLGTTMPSNPTSTPSTVTPVFGTAPTTNSSSVVSTTKPQSPPSFGSNAFSTFSPSTKPPSSVTTTQVVNKDQPIQSTLNASVLSKNAQQPVFGSVLSSNPASSQPNQFDIKISNGVKTSSFTSIQQSKPIVTTSFGSATTTSSQFAFGAAPVFNTAQATQPNSFGIGKTNNASVNVFGSSLSSQGTSSTPLFGSATNTKSNIFDQSPKIDSILSNRTAEPEKTVATTQNIFGSSTAKPSSTFSFSGTQPSNTNNIFGGQTTASANSFNFGGSAQKSETSAPERIVDTQKPFAFGGSVGEPSKPVVFGSKTGVTAINSSSISDTAKTFNFGTNNVTPTSNLFNNIPTNEAPKMFSFGGNAGTPSFGANSGKPAFGGNSGTPAFGGNSGTPAFGGNSGTPAFGGNSGTSAFGGNSGTPAFGGNSGTPAFGGNSSTPTFGGNSGTPAFGGSSGTPAFGANSGPPSFGPNSGTPSFGGNTGTPAFGGNSGTPAFGGNSGTPAFGGNSGAPSFGANSGTPSFGANSGTPSFSASATPVFGGNVTPNFGGNSTPSFGNIPTFGSANFNASGGSNFGGNTGNPAFSTSTGTADANKTFNFTGNDQTPSPIPNLFNIGPGNSSPRTRTIRTARRTNR